MAIPLDPHYIPAFSIEDVLLDKDTGAPLSGGKVYFEQDDQRGILKPVFQITGTSPNYTFTQLPNPVILSSIGTFEDTLGNPVIPYFFPYVEDSEGNLTPDLYFVRVTSSEDVPQFNREAQPYLFTESHDEVLSAFSNELSNPQFADVIFDTTATSVVYSIGTVTDAVYTIAPDWEVVVSCATAGTFTVSQTKPTGSNNVITNPGTLLRISSNGLSKLWLRQRLFGSPNLWGNNFVAGSFVAKTYVAADAVINLYYAQSSGSMGPQLIVSGTVSSDGEYRQFTDSSDFIPDSDNLQNYPNAYISIYFDLPLNTDLDITSVMIATTGAVEINNIDYDQQSNARQNDFLFHYYEPQLKAKPIPSLLTGWDFPLNPFQFGLSGSFTNTPAYIADQTIAASSGGSIGYIRVTNTQALQFTTSADTQAFYIQQYLSGAQAFEMSLSTLAAYINVIQFNHPDTVCRIYLYYNSTGGVIPPVATGLGTVNAAGEFTLSAGGWAPITQSNGFLNNFTLDGQNQIIEKTLYGYLGRQFYDSIPNAKFSIVVTFACPTSGTSIVINSIGLMGGDIATRPAPQTIDEVLRECQYYYERSRSVLLSQNTLVDSITAQISSFPSGGNVVSYAAPFGFSYKNIKRAVPGFTTLSTMAADSGYVTLRTFTAGGGTSVTVTESDLLFATGWTWDTGLNYVNAYPLIHTALSTVGSIGFNYNAAAINFQYILDARLGIV